MIVLGTMLSCFPMLANELLIPAAARGAGANGTFFQTDLRIVNLSAMRADVKITFLSSGSDNRNAASLILSIEPRQSREFNDVLQSLFSLQTGLGALRLESGDSVAATSRTYTTSSSGPCLGSFGQFIPALDPQRAELRSVIPGVSISALPTAGSRSNFGAVNPGVEPATVSVTLRNGDGSVIGTTTLSIPPLGHVQQALSALFNITSMTSTNAFLEINASIPLLAYVSVVDNASGDSMFIPAGPDTGVPRETTILAKQWVFEPPTLEARVGELMTIKVRALDVEHGVSFSGVGPFTCSNEQAGQCIVRPGEVVTVTFTPREEGTFAFFCTRFCDESLDGTAGHSTMRGSLVVRR